MPRESPTRDPLAAERTQHCGVFRIEDANAAGVTANQVHGFAGDGVIERVLPNTYRLLAVRAIVGAGPARRAPVGGRWCGRRGSIGRSALPAGGRPRDEARDRGAHTARALVRRSRRVYHGERRALMVRMVNGLPTTGVEATLLRLAHVLDSEAFEIACEDARRRRLTSIPALQRYLERHAQARTTRRRARCAERSPSSIRSTRRDRRWRSRPDDSSSHMVSTTSCASSRSTWKGRTYRYDFAFPRRRGSSRRTVAVGTTTPTDYEHDNEKWSVPGRYGYRIVFATWAKIDRHPESLIDELKAATRG